MGTHGDRAAGAGCGSGSAAPEFVGTLSGAPPCGSACSTGFVPVTRFGALVACAASAAARAWPVSKRSVCDAELNELGLEYAPDATISRLGSATPVDFCGCCQRTSRSCDSMMPRTFSRSAANASLRKEPTSRDVARSPDAARKSSRSRASSSASR